MDVAVAATLTTVHEAVSVFEVKCHRGLSKIWAQRWFAFDSMFLLSSQCVHIARLQGEVPSEVCASVRHGAVFLGRSDQKHTKHKETRDKKQPMGLPPRKFHPGYSVVRCLPRSWTTVAKKNRIQTSWEVYGLPRRGRLVGRS